MSTTPEALERLIALSEITEVLHRYCRGVDRLDADLLRDCYHSDGTDEHPGFAGDADRYVAWVFEKVGPWVSTHHDISNVMVDIDGDDAWSECHWTGFYRIPNGDALVDQVSAGRYLDHFRRRDSRWRIQHRACVTDWSRSGPSTARPAEGRLAGRRDHDDLLYRLRGISLPA